MTPPPSDSTLRRNALALGADYSLFLVALSFASPATILPAFAAELGAPNVVIGAIPAVITVGWYLPSLFAAGHTETLARRLPFVLRYTIWERVPLLVLALVAFTLARTAPGPALALVLIALLVMTGVGGVLMPAWMDIVGRAIPLTLRGRFFALSNALGSAGGFVGSFASAQVLATVPSPASYGICFLASAVFMALSYWALVLVEEPHVPAPTPPLSVRAYLARIPGLLRRDRNLSAFLVARSCMAGAAGSAGFFTVFALRVHGAAAWQAATFTGALLGGQIVANLALGWLADRAGHRLVLALGAAGLVAANALAVVAPSLDVLVAVFPLLGVFNAAINVSGLNILLEFAPSARERPTYVGLGNTTLGPVMFVTPLLAGVAADAVGLRWVFASAGVLGLLAAGLLLGSVRDPRH